MKCKRCEGLMVFDRIYGPDEAIFDLPIWRCLNCGATVDPLILQKRVAKDQQTIPTEENVA
ncbi:MAG: hypothetical protein MRJ96_06170 [Nitrospirales bacterium]|nr:hypothetical protein [Nitrospira sp.]MDR4501021.1 hypothetical protein [Nitrospirales bacterium]